MEKECADQERKPCLLKFQLPTWTNQMPLSTKIDHNDNVYVWRSECEGFKPKNTVPTVKHGGGTMML